ncbi:shikimate dehydrogenase (NADP(+)) [Clostridiales bacterium]|nr:shikimate dehydrogenase (NADP(+)) [Clostridiales bacterium]
MKQFGLTGYPLGHSLSPVIHRELFKIGGINGEYNLFEISPDALKNEFSKLTGLDGFNVTIPHKIDVIPLLDELDERAALFGAVNTVKPGKKLKGYNTDCYGFLRAIKMADIDLSGNVLLCGSGGVARMFAFEAALAGCSLTIAVRDNDIPSANILAEEIKNKLNKNAKVLNLKEVNESYNLIINGTPVGMHPNINACILPKEIIQKADAVFDAIYNPEETLFVKYAKEAGIKYSNGLSMLVWQAAVAEEIWNDIKFTEKDIQKVIEITKKELKK